MKSYQLTYLLSPDLTQEQIQNLITRIQSLLQEQGGILIETQKNQTIDLGDEIKKKKKAFLNNIKFQLDSDKIQNFKKELKKLTEILRFMILVSLPSKQALSPIKKSIRKLSKEKKVELKDIEEKLSLLLGE